MNTVAKLQAAMKRLEELRELASAGPWKVVSWKEHWAVSTEYTLHDSEEDVIVWAGDYASSEATMPKGNAELIATLYSTIDAQLTLLSSAIGDYDPGSDVQVPLVAYSEDLADAILKGA